MSDDETPKSDDAPAGDAGSSDDTSPGDDATLPETSPTPPVAAPAAAADDRAGVFVPRWVAFLVGGLVALLLVGGAGFALGRATDDDHGDDDHHAVVERPGGRLPGGPGNQGDGGRPEIPLPGPGGGTRGGQGDVPGVPSRGVLLGVAVESATGGTSGARVAELVDGSPAQDAGLEVGDVITKVDDTDVTDAQELVAAIRAHESGDDITITYERDGESQTADVTLGGGGSDSSASGPSSTS